MVLKFIPCTVGVNKNVSFDDGIGAENFIKSAIIYEDVLKSLGIGHVPVQLAKDETAIIRKVCFNQVDYTLVGFCGEENPVSGKHICEKKCLVKVGDGEDGYNKIINAFAYVSIGT